jgi:drug/metabolite transporter (DMT)-like permease
MGPRDLGALVLLSALWGASFIYIRVAVPALGPFVLVELRVGLAAVVLALCAAFVGRLPKLRSRWRQFALLGAVNVAIPFSLISAAEINLTASLAAILNSTTVMFTAVVAAVWMGDALTPRKLVGVALGIAGVTVLVGWDPIAMNWAVVLSVGAMLAASLAYALGSVYAKRTFADSPPLEIASGQLTAAAMLMVPLAAVSAPEQSPSTIVVLSVLGLALPSTAVAYMLYFRLIANVGPTSTSTVTLLVPLFGLLFGVVLLDEPVGIGTLAGLVLILSSVILITGLGAARPKARL